ncbi:hypothetical protein [Actinomadura madurae]|uniref:hypothetical protein n=1 Tax=Actinomadura madurae TaxID=1993 RepID=UPI0020D2311D|nr:hypothetical protein [Actinomadura madurae]MCP9947200.1 hypothetical protein [Actinomadura madurae]MCP9963966.1 hypothetical protein [Actinomadura madurae]MCP9976440.1 hypothetical protein [Actinomadura madurae]MCQ0012067.1 hypothetical protein [Actinomadura madurae]
MTAVLTIRAGGSVAGSCGKSCYDAEHPKCRCICIRLNHGVGLEQAIANTRAHHADWLARARADGQVIDTFEVLGAPATQHALF